jgi:hypothetical protein
MRGGEGEEERCLNQLQLHTKREREKEKKSSANTDCSYHVWMQCTKVGVQAGRLL